MKFFLPSGQQREEQQLASTLAPLWDYPTKKAHETHVSGMMLRLNSFHFQSSENPYAKVNQNGQVRQRAYIDVDSKDTQSLLRWVSRLLISKSIFPTFSFA